MMTDLVSMPKKIVPYLRMTIEQMGSKEEANFAIYHLGFEWGRETVKLSGETSGHDELKAKTILTAIHSGITNLEVDVDEDIRIRPYDSNIDDDYFLAGYVAGTITGLLGEYHTAKVKKGYYKIVRSEKKIESELFKDQKTIEGVELENLKRGNSYIIVDDAKDANRTFETFYNVMKEGMPGLCFTRIFPSKIREGLSDVKFPIFWLSTVEGTYKINTVRPENFCKQVVKIFSAFQNMKQGIVMIHGIQFLLTYIDFNDILETLQEIRDINSVENGIFLVAVDPGVIKKDDFNKLKTEFEIFDI